MPGMPSFQRQKTARRGLLERIPQKKKGESEWLRRQTSVGPLILFNPWRGCSKVSPGCAHCYADTLSGRNPKVLGVWGPQGTRVLASDAQWCEPTKWNSKQPRRFARLTFCASLADVFEDWQGQMVDSHERALFCQEQLANAQLGGTEPFTLYHARQCLWDLIRRTPNLIWQLLTKRPENIGRMMPHGSWPNVWLGTSVESQEWTWRVDALLEAPQTVPVRFLSIEPLLGPVDLMPCLGGLQWIILGGESGGQARECKEEWMRDLIWQCSRPTAPVAVFVKQLGRNFTRRGIRQRTPRDPSHGSNPLDFPAGMNIQKFPPLEDEAT